LKITSCIELTSLSEEAGVALATYAEANVSYSAFLP